MMVKVVHQICIKDETFTDGDKQFKIKRGTEYTTSPPSDDSKTVTVFSTYWFRAPKNLFAGAR